MTLSIIQGDLFDPAHNFDTLAHGTNCKGLMGSGIAPIFKEKFPAMYQEYKTLCDQQGENLAGSVQLVHNLYNPATNKPINVANLFTQVNIGANADYHLLRLALDNLNQIAINPENNISSVGLPWIGCGIGGLNRLLAYPIMLDSLHLSPVNYTIVELK